MLGDKFRPPALSPSAVAQSRMVSMGTCTRLPPVRENSEEVCVCVFVCACLLALKKVYLFSEHKVI